MSFQKVETVFAAVLLVVCFVVLAHSLAANPQLLDVFLPVLIGFILLLWLTINRQQRQS